MNSPQAIMQQHGKTFALAAKLLTPASRIDATELYAFARTVDDWIDDNTDLQANKDEALANIMALQQAIKTGDASIQQLLGKHAVSNAVLQAFLQAQLHDQGERRIADERALINYSYGVAGSIGAMMRPILGAPIAAEMHAISLGIAMQLTNIARDVAEDAVRQRVYIPATFFDAPLSFKEILNPSQQQAQAIFVAIAKLLQLADDYYAFAALGYSQIPLRNRLSIVAAASMYRAIGLKILQRGEAQYWQGRVSIGLLPKTGIAIMAIFKPFYWSNQTNNHNKTAIIDSIQQAIASFNHI
jgi:15-cis-phytoene synthase